MALLLPKTLQTLITDDSAVTRGFTNVKSAVDPLLALCNSTFQVAQDGTLAFVRTIKAFTAIVINGTTVNGTTVNAGTSNTTGTATANSVVSGQGFKSTIPMGYVYQTAPTVGTNYPTVWYSVAQNSTAFNYTMYVALPAAGSMTGISTYFSGTTTAVGVTGIIYKNGTSVYSGVLIKKAGGNVNNVLAFAKGLYPFAQGDVITCNLNFDTAANVVAKVELQFELGA